MKKGILALPALLIALVCVCVLVLQPLHITNSESTRFVVHIGKTVPLHAIAEVAGGYRCYLTDTEYFWISAQSCEQKVGEPLRAQFRLDKPTILYRGET